MDVLQFAAEQRMFMGDLHLHLCMGGKCSSFCAVVGSNFTKVAEGRGRVVMSAALC